jgi:hypothetical protein
MHLAQWSIRFLIRPDSYTFHYSLCQSCIVYFPDWYLHQLRSLGSLRFADLPVSSFWHMSQSMEHPECASALIGTPVSLSTVRSAVVDMLTSHSTFTATSSHTTRIESPVVVLRPIASMEKQNSTRDNDMITETRQRKPTRRNGGKLLSFIYCKYHSWVILQQSSGLTFSHRIIKCSGKNLWRLRYTESLHIVQDGRSEVLTSVFWDITPRSKVQPSIYQTVRRNFAEDDTLQHERLEQSTVYLYMHFPHSSPHFQLTSTSTTWRLQLTATNVKSKARFRAAVI